MNRFQAIFDALEQKFYQSNREKISLNIGALVFFHLLSTAALLYLAFKVKHFFQTIPEGGQAGEMLSTIPNVMIIGIALFLIALAAGLFIAAMLHHYSAKPLHRINSVFSEMNVGDADLSKEVPEEGFGEIACLAVHPDYRNHGRGKGT